MNQQWNRMEDGDTRMGVAGALPRRRVSSELSARLRVLASREARRRRLLSSPAEILGEAKWRARLWMDNLARPYAVPFAGGLASALFLFIAIAPAFPIHQTILDDVPVRLTTPASLQATFVFPTVPPPLEDIDLVVDVDSAGRVVDYVVTGGGKAWASDPAARKSLEQTLVCTRFNPATLFGQPQAGSVRITMRRSEMEVKG